VGKTCLVLRYVEGKFFDQKSSTIGASFMVKKL
jgi:GTPase SAR1 family protein